MKKAVFGGIVLALLVPVLAFAETAPTPYQFQRQGIFDCNQSGGNAMSVGSLGALGGAFVPVSDAAVELNTGILVYKECVLREVVKQEGIAATSQLLKNSTVGITTGRNGNPEYVVNPGQELLTNDSDPTFATFIKDGTLQNLNPALQGPEARALARYYQADTRAQGSSLRCPYQGDLIGFQTTGAFVSFSDFLAASNPQCDPVSAFYLSQDIADSRIARAQQYQMDQWNWGRGYYPVVDSNGNVITPAVNVQESYQAQLDSPLHQLESANDVGQMIGALYANLAIQIISDSQGLSGLSQGVGGQPSYLDQIVAESAQNLRGAAVNAALQILNAAQQVESTYLQTVNSIASTLAQTIGQLRDAENQCWNLIIPKVCTTPLASGNTCVDANGNTLKIATSTAFSQPIIDSQIAPIATTTIANINASQKALALIDNLIAGVTNTSSVDAQRVALQQLDSLVAQNALHSQANVQAVSQQLQDVQTTMTNLVQNTVKAWGDSTDVNIGWCNVNNRAVLDSWTKKWKQ